MIRFLLFVTLVLAVALGFVWLADRPGEVLLTWQGYEVEASLMIAMIAVVILMVVTGIAWWLFRTIVGFPARMGAVMRGRRRDRGYKALTRGMIAIGAGDVKAASRAAGEASKLLGEDALVLLLAAQSAQIAGDPASARNAFEKLRDTPETRVLGLHGLFIEAQRQGEPAAALHFAEEAHDISAQIPWAGQAIFDYRSRVGDWDRALAALAGNEGAGLVDKTQSKRLRAVLLTGKAMALEAGSPEDARAAATEANRLAPELTPAAVVAARLLTRANDVRRACKVLEAAWRAEPHPELAEAYADVRPGDAARDRLKRVQNLAAMRPNHPEGAIAVARVAVEAQDWTLARRSLDPLLVDAPSERVCLLMADIEEGENGDKGRSRAWVARALYAPRDPCWTADGRAYERWAPLSPSTGRVDAFEWKIVRMPGPPPREIDLDAPDDERPTLVAGVIQDLEDADGSAGSRDDGEVDATVEDEAEPPILIPDDPGPDGDDRRPG